MSSGTIVPMLMVGAVIGCVGLYFLISSVIHLIEGRYGSALLRFLLGVVCAGPIAIGWVLPMVYSPKTKAPRTHCMSNLSQIGKALVMYSMDNTETYPETFQGLTNTANAPKLFICPKSGHLAGDMTHIQEWTDYAYVSGLKASDLPDCVVAFCSPANHQDQGGNVLFNDMSVRWLTKKDFDALLADPAAFFGTTHEEDLADLKNRTKILRSTKPILRKP